MTTEEIKGDMENPNEQNIGCRRLSSPGDASKELFDGFKDWSASVGTHGIQTSYALIAANWAVYGSADKIMSNSFAKWSIIIIIAFLGVNLICTQLMSHLYARRCDYADENWKRWEEEHRKENAMSSDWPYTKFIVFLGDFLRLLKVIAPVASGTIFIAGLLSCPKV